MSSAIPRGKSRAYRSLLVEYINCEAEKHEDAITTVVLPEYIPRGWWQHLLHNQTTLLIKGKLLFDPNIVVVSVPYHLWKSTVGTQRTDIRC
ncbi:MAG TPA: hypothetical protein VFU37_11060 [Pyrinomonadaceae bacterium]|nr:hypothetical protein [Pyrinomonadaceae bacterium]